LAAFWCCGLRFHLVGVLEAAHLIGGGRWECHGKAKGRPRSGRPFGVEQRRAPGSEKFAVTTRTFPRTGALFAMQHNGWDHVIYGWGLRRTEASKLDLADWGRNPAAPEFGRHGMLHVRYGKAVRGQPPR